MSLVTQAFIFERYGPRLGVADLATVLKITEGAIHNQVSAEKLPIVTYMDGGKRWADYRHVAEHFDTMHDRAESTRKKDKK